MQERFKKLYELQHNLYSNNAPIILSSGVLLNDTATGSIIVQLKFHSLSDISIVALKVSICAYDIEGNSIEGVNDYQYLDLNVLNGNDFGSNKAIIMPNINTRSFQISNITIIKSNGVVDVVELPLQPLPKSVLLSTILKNQESLKQYKIETTNNSEYIPQTKNELWCCSCGEWNVLNKCSKCGVSKEEVFKYLDASLLEPKLQHRLSNEKLAKEKADKDAKSKKKIKITIISVAIVLMICIIGGLIYSSQHKYDEIAGIYALTDLEDAKESLYKYHKDSIDEFGFNPYSFELEIKGSGKVYGLWFVNNRGTMTPRAATVKSVSDTDVVVFDILDYPNEYVTFTINLETGEAIYSSRGLTLKYRRISEELANNGYQECSKEEVNNEISFIQNLFNLKTIEAICNQYPNASTKDAMFDVKIEGTFCSAIGTYEIWLDDGWRVFFAQELYDTNTEKQNLIDNLNNVFGEYKYYDTLDVYSWKSQTHNLEVDYYPHKGINFYLDEPINDSSDDSNGSNEDDDNITKETFISNGTFTFHPRSFVMRFDDVDKNTSGYNYTYMRMNGESSLFYEIAEISGGYNNVRSVGMISFVKNIDTTMSLDEDYTENMITKINVLVEDADDVPPILVSCMCAVDPSLNFTNAYNLNFDVAEKAGTLEGYTHNGINYILYADLEYYYIIISIEDENSDDGQKSECDILGHLWKDATCTIPMTCSRCNVTSGNALGHDWGNPTCTTPRSCCECFEIDPNSKPLGHSFIDGECMICGADDLSYFVLTSSIYDIILTDEEFVAYITMTGGNVVIYEIDDTNIVLCEWGDWDGDIVPLTFYPISYGNTFVTIYIEDHDVSIKINVTVSDHVHEYKTNIIEPKCLEQGYTIYTCECGYSYNADYVETNGHTIVIDKAVEPKCIETGLSEGKHCSVCDEILETQIEISAKGHSETIDKAIEPTCTTNGLTEGKHCNVCNEILIPQQEIPKQHKYINYVCQDCNYHYYTEGLTFDMSDDGNTYSVVEYVGSDLNVIIPALYENKPVTKILKDAFRGCNIVSVFVPSSITSISNLAFQGCSTLVEINVDINNENYKSIDGNLYSKDNKTLIQYAIGKNNSSFVVPDFVTNIEEGAFLGCVNLSNVVISDNVENIGNAAFLGCTNITDITIPISVTIINDYTFSDCSNLTNIIISDNVSSVGISAFYNCNNLKNIYYTGTQEEWNSINIGDFNVPYIGNATIHFNYTKTE